LWRPALKCDPEEAINAAIIGAYAMGISNTHGSITVGKANFIITKPISYRIINVPVWSNLIGTVAEGMHKKEELLGSSFFYLNLSFIPKQN
jgi:imidazolonepropionase-like amidohydrolase